MVGWLRVAEAQPNTAHRALADLERDGVIPGVITQNVDRLHQAAGSRRVVELHGALAEVVCLDCGATEPRDALQARLRALNPEFVQRGVSVEIAPDGDAEVVSEALAGFRVAMCERCDGTLKPHVVFFGENVPRPRVDEAFAMLDDASALLVVGSSLTVFSGYRFVRRAAERAIPVAIVNIGPTRGDPLAAARIEAPAGVVLPVLARALPGWTS